METVVNRQSLETCLHWADSGYPFNSTVFQSIASHATAASDEEVLQLIGSVVGAPVDPINSECPLHACTALNIIII